jgi:hypothetical protein
MIGTSDPWSAMTKLSLLLSKDRHCFPPKAVTSGILANTIDVDIVHILSMSLSLSLLDVLPHLNSLTYMW